eukprot:262738-Prorocentrum_minimum.AAC.4
MNPDSRSGTVIALHSVQPMKSLQPLPTSPHSRPNTASVRKYITPPSLHPLHNLLVLFWRFNNQRSFVKSPQNILFVTLRCVWCGAKYRADSPSERDCRRHLRATRGPIQQRVRARTREACGPPAAPGRHTRQTRVVPPSHPPHPSGAPAAAVIHERADPHLNALCNRPPRPAHPIHANAPYECVAASRDMHACCQPAIPARP